MGLFDKLKGKKDKVDKKSEYELRNELFEATKNVKVDMKLVERDAKKHPDRMIFQDVKNPEEYKWRSWALHFSMNGEYEKAIEYCNKGIEINPNSAYLFYIRGRSKGDIEHFIEGIEDLNDAIKIKPSFADAFVERGYIKQKIGDTIRAEEDYKRAKEIEPSIVLPELLMRGRGITWYLVVSPFPKKKELEKIEKLILSHTLFENDFKGTYLNLHNNVSDTITWLKIRSPFFANKMLKTSETHSYYRLVYDSLYDHIKNALNKNGFKLLGFSFELNYQMYPEEPKEIMPMVKLELPEKELDKE